MVNREMVERERQIPKHAILVTSHSVTIVELDYYHDVKDDYELHLKGGILIHSPKNSTYLVRGMTNNNIQEFATKLAGLNSVCVVHFNPQIDEKQKTL